MQLYFTSNFRWFAPGNFYSIYWLYHDSHAYANVLPSEPAAGYLDAGKLVFADEAHIDARRGMGFKDHKHLTHSHGLTRVCFVLSVLLFSYLDFRRIDLIETCDEMPAGRFHLLRSTHCRCCYQFRPVLGGRCWLLQPREFRMRWCMGWESSCGSGLETCMAPAVPCWAWEEHSKFSAFSMTCLVKSHV